MTMLDGLTDYFAARQQQRAQRIASKWAGLSRREQKLVREAAVMGYVQGHRHANTKIPHDGDILELVLDSVDHFADLYPFLAALPKRKRMPKK